MRDLFSPWWDLTAQLTGRKKRHNRYNNLFKGYFTQKSTLLFAAHSFIANLCCVLSSAEHNRWCWTTLKRKQQWTPLIRLCNSEGGSSFRFGVKLMCHHRCVFIGYLAMDSSVSHSIRNTRTMCNPIRAAYGLCALRIHDNWAPMCRFIPDL